MASPHPPPHLSLGRETWQIYRLGIMYKNDVGLQVEPSSVLLVDFRVQVEVGGPEYDRQALEAVMKRLGHAIKFRVAVDHLPAGIKPKFLHKRNHPAKDFRDSSSRTRGVDVDDSPVANPSRQLP